MMSSLRRSETEFRNTDKLAFTVHEKLTCEIKIIEKCVNKIVRPVFPVENNPRFNEVALSTQRFILSPTPDRYKDVERGLDGHDSLVEFLASTGNLLRNLEYCEIKIRKKGVQLSQSMKKKETSPFHVWIKLTRESSEASVMPEMVDVNLLGGDSDSSFDLVGLISGWKNGRLNAVWKEGSGWGRLFGGTVTDADVTFSFCKRASVLLFLNRTPTFDKESCNNELTLSGYDRFLLSIFEKEEVKQEDCGDGASITVNTEFEEVVKKSTESNLDACRRVLFELVGERGQGLSGEKYKELYTIIAGHEDGMTLAKGKVHVAGQSLVLKCDGGGEFFICKVCLNKAQTFPGLKTHKCVLHVNGEYTVVVAEVTTAIGVIAPRFVAVMNGADNDTILRALKKKHRKCNPTWMGAKSQVIFRTQDSTKAVAYYAASQLAHWILHSSSSIKSSPYVFANLSNISFVPWCEVELDRLRTYLKIILTTNNKSIQFSEPDVIEEQPPTKLLFKFRNFKAGMGIYKWSFSQEKGTYIGRINSTASGSGQNHYHRIHSPHLQALIQKDKGTYCHVAQTPIHDVTSILESTIQTCVLLAMIFKLKDEKGNMHKILNSRLECFKQLPKDCQVEEYLDVIFKQFYRKSFSLVDFT